MADDTEGSMFRMRRRPGEEAYDPGYGTRGKPGLFTYDRSEGNYTGDLADPDNPVNVFRNGTTYYRLGYDLDAIPGGPDLGIVKKYAGQSIYDPEYGWLVPEQAAIEMISAQAARNPDGFFDKGGPWEAFSKTIGPMMGLSGVVAGGLGLAADAGFAGAGEVLANSGYQSLGSSLAEHAAANGGSFSDITRAFSGASAGGTSGLPTSYLNGSMFADAGGLTSDAGPQSLMDFSAKAGESVTGGMSNMNGFINDANPLVAAGVGATGAISPFVTSGAGGAGASAAGGGLFGNLSLSNIGMGLGAAGALGAGAKALGGGSTSQTTKTNMPPMTAEERELISLTAELTKRQLSAIDQLQPFQRAMLETALEQMMSQSATDAAISGAVSPAEQAAYARSEFERAQRFGPIQDEILQRQLDAIRRDGAASPEQEALIKRATDSAIGSANADIDASTARGIGLISDELSNARGLRLSDSPMSGEAALLAREGVIQKGGIEKSLRANQANAQLNYPLAVTQLTSQIGQNQQAIADSAKQFQADLRQKAFQNRLALTGQASSTGIGLASTGGGNGALNALTQQRLGNASRTEETSRGIGLSDIGNVASGIGGLMNSASTLKLFG